MARHRIVFSVYAGDTPAILQVSLQTDLTDRFDDIKSRLELSEGVTRVTKMNRYSFKVVLGKAFRWDEGPLDAMIELLKEVFGYTDPEVEHPPRL